MGTSAEVKHKTGLPRLLELAGGHRNLLVVSGVLSVVATTLLLAPFVPTYFVEKPLSEHAGPRRPEHRRIEFDHVCFSYGLTDDNTGIPALNDVSFVAEPDRFTVLVGPSSSAVSPLSPTSFRISGMSSREACVSTVSISMRSDRSICSSGFHLFQDEHLLYDTIGENIGMENTGATFKQVAEVAHRARCHEFIGRLRQDYRTAVGQRGASLSGGERKRVSIARAIPKDASILVFDETTVFTDPENEATVRQAIDDLVADKTVIMIANPLKSVRGTDRILLLKDSRLKEAGRHDDLLARVEVYRRLRAIQHEAAGWQVRTMT